MPGGQLARSCREGVGFLLPSSLRISLFLCATVERGVGWLLPGGLFSMSVASQLLWSGINLFVLLFCFNSVFNFSELFMQTMKQNVGSVPWCLFVSPKLINCALQ